MHHEQVNNYKKTTNQTKINVLLIKVKQCKEES